MTVNQLSSLPSVTPSLMNLVQGAPITMDLLIQKIPFIRAAELYQCLVHYKEQPEEEQAKQKSSLEALSYAILKHQDVALAEVLLEELPEAVLCTLLDQESAFSYLFQMSQGRSLLSIFVIIAVRRERHLLLHALLIIFAENIKKGFGSDKEAYDISNLLLQTAYFNDGIDFVLMLPQEQFSQVMSQFASSLAFCMCDRTDRPLIVSFFERGFERVFRWFEAHPNEALMYNLGRYVDSQPLLFEAVKTCMQKAIAERDFSFLFSLFNVFSGEQQERFGAAISQWKRSSDYPEANFFHWLFSTEGPYATTIIYALINSIPFAELAAMFDTPDVYGRRPSEIDPSRHEKVVGALLMRVAEEWAATKQGELSFDTLCAFLFFADMVPVGFQSQDIETLQSSDSQCFSVGGYYLSLRDSFRPIQEHEQMVASLNDMALLKLACLFGRGSKYFRAALMLGRRIEKQVRATILRTSNSEMWWPSFVAFKKTLETVTTLSFDHALHDLEGKAITYENMEIFFKRGLSFSQLQLCIKLMESSQDPVVRRFLPTWRDKFRFWKNFPAFLSERTSEGKITGEQVKDIIEKLRGMNGRSLSADGIHLSAIGSILEKYGDEQSKRVGARFVTIFTTLLKFPSFQNTFPSIASILRTAYFIEVTLPRCKCVEERVLPRCETGLSFLLQYNPLRGRVYLLTKPDKVSKLSAGTFKIATPALALSLCDPGFAEHKIRLFTISREDPQSEFFRQEMEHMHCHEIKILHTFQNHANFERAESVAEYSYPRIDPFTGIREEVQRKSLMVDPAIPLENFLAPLGLRPFTQVVFLMIPLCSALADLHQSGYVHGDLKIPNIMMEPAENPQDGYRPLLIDFGLSVPCEVGKPIDPTLRAGNYANGIYGSIWHTAPELLGVRNFRGDHFKVDIFALGFLMYQIIKGEPPAWKAIPEDYQRLGCPEGQVQQAHQAALKNAVATCVSTMWAPIDAKMQKHEILTLQEKVMRILCYLLHPDPELRWSAREAHIALMKLL